MDAINAMFEIAGAALVWLSVRKALQDRQFLGVHWAPTALFTTWGLWNVWYYPALGQSWSTIAAVVMFIANATYLFLMWKYREPKLYSKTWWEKQRPIPGHELRECPHCHIVGSWRKDWSPGQCPCCLQSWT